VRILIPYCSGRLQDGVFGAASASGYAVELHDVGASESEYWRLLSRVWREASSDVIIVEHDVKVARDTIAGFDECKRLWCCAGYPYLGGRHIGLGCVRFRREVMREFPDALVEVGELDDLAHGRGHWCSLDRNLTNVLRGYGLDACPAHGTVEHLGDNKPSHPPCRHHVERTENV
jgi:hypothetical protein